MDFLMKAVRIDGRFSGNYLIPLQLLFFLFLSYHGTSGYVAHHHEIVKRGVNLTAVDHGLGGALTMIFSPIANLAARANIEIPVISNFRNKDERR
ncbi:uncharacterized protein [Drosophila suzukii]|uniref:Uncharacterized protein n=1 Tax=Drosophila suzukii TaxID=28584 RepID=A0ABM4TPI2_DROSZ